jgi:hypothetical protein
MSPGFSTAAGAGCAVSALRLGLEERRRSVTERKSEVTRGSAEPRAKRRMVID